MTKAPAVVLPLVLLTLAAGCATTVDRGWHGEGAQPFDASAAGCREEAAAGPLARGAAFEACMARHGWHRPAPPARD